MSDLIFLSNLLLLLFNTYGNGLVSAEFSQKQLLAMQLIKSTSYVAGAATSCNDLKTANDATRLRDSIFKSAEKNDFFLELDLQTLRSISASTFIKTKDLVANRLFENNTYCERAIRDLKKIKNDMNIAGKDIFASVGILCRLCDDRECNTISDSYIGDDNAFNGIAIVFSDEYRYNGRNDYSPDQDQMKYKFLNQKWSVKESYYNKSDQLYNLFDHNMRIDRVTLIAETKPYKYSLVHKCEVKDYAYIKTEWFGKKRDEYLNSRKF